MEYFMGETFDKEKNKPWEPVMLLCLFLYGRDKTV